MDDRTFIDEVAENLRCDAARAEAVVYAVFQALRDRLTWKEAGDVAAQLPGMLRTLWEEGEHPGREVARMHLDDFVAHVRGGAAMADDAEAERALQVVFRALQRLLGSPHGVDGEAWDVYSQLPKDVKQLWLAAGRRA
jgi:uncharacterized protein (DUF2267 family)